LGTTPTNEKTIAVFVLCKDALINPKTLQTNSSFREKAIGHAPHHSLSSPARVISRLVVSLRLPRVDYLPKSLYNKKLFNGYMV
jgi:hypothetical protein